MNSKSDFRLVMLSAGFEHGGNVTHRYFDGHDELFVYPFESQIGNRFANDFMSSIERQQYRYPEFPAGLSSSEYYEIFYDEELKTLLRKPNASKFKEADLQMDEKDRIAAFVDYVDDKTPTRALLVEAFFRATFTAWKNYCRSGNNHIYVGYSPAIGIDADKIISDFHDAHIVHVVRNPYSAFSDTKRRPFPLPLVRYALTWNIYHSTVYGHQRRYPKNVTIIRYEDLIANPRDVLWGICERIGIRPSEKLLYPSWNGHDITGNIYPWGTIKAATPESNVAAAMELSVTERDLISKYTEVVRKQFCYEEF